MPCLPWRVGISLDVGLEQLLEERAVVDERLALRLYADVSLLLREVKRMGGPVMLNNIRVVDRYVSDLLIEVVNGITAFAHHPGHETIRLTHSRRRFVDERGLHYPPSLVVLCSRFRSQRDDVELLSPAFARDKLVFGGPLITDLAYGSFVLRTKVLLEPFCPFSARR
jgi:hypothetical protein